MKVELINLEEKLSMATLAAKVNELIEAHNALVDKAPQRDRGPASEREMTKIDAARCMFGDLKDASHKVAAETLGLSYGQIYSARKGYTFKAIEREADVLLAEFNAAEVLLAEFNAAE